jgi:hypothetical protein
MSSRTLWSTPFGVSGVFSRYGGTPERIAALLTHSEPYFPR